MLPTGSWPKPPTARVTCHEPRPSLALRRHHPDRAHHCCGGIELSPIEAPHDTRALVPAVDGAALVSRNYAGSVLSEEGTVLTPRELEMELVGMLLGQSKWDDKAKRFMIRESLTDEALTDIVNRCYTEELRLPCGCMLDNLYIVHTNGAPIVDVRLVSMAHLEKLLSRTHREGTE